jgi:hypothetical protein
MQGENHEMIKPAADSLDYQPIVFDYMPFSNDLAMFITAVSFQFIFVSYGFRCIHFVQYTLLRK